MSIPFYVRLQGRYDPDGHGFCSSPQNCYRSSLTLTRNVPASDTVHELEIVSWAVVVIRYDAAAGKKDVALGIGIVACCPYD